MKRVRLFLLLLLFGSALAQHAAVLIDDVVPGSAAEKAGLQPGDRIAALDGKKIEGMPDLEAVIDAHRPGDTVPIKIECPIEAHQFSDGPPWFSKLPKEERSDKRRGETGKRCGAGRMKTNQVRIDDLAFGVDHVRNVQSERGRLLLPSQETPGLIQMRGKSEEQPVDVT